MPYISQYLFVFEQLTRSVGKKKLEYVVSFLLLSIIVDKLVSHGILQND